MNKIESGGFVKRLSVVICGYLDLDDGIQWMGEGPGWSRAPRATEAAQPAPEAWVTGGDSPFRKSWGYP